MVNGSISAKIIFQACQYRHLRLSRLRMKNHIHILDGGLGSDLFLSGGYNKEKVNNDPLWLARVTYEHPEDIKACHKRFINAGSEVISTGSYQASVQGYIKHCGVTKGKAEEIIASSVDIAKAAINECEPSHEVLIAGSISPYGAILHDMSEYTGTYIEKVSYDQLKDFHKTNIQILAAKGVKLFAFETIPALKEAQVLVDLLSEYPACKAWISFTTQSGTHTSYGDPFTTVFETFQSNPQIIAVGTNCSDAKYTMHVLKAANGLLGDHQSCIVYPDNRRCANTTDLPENLPWISDISDWLATGQVGWIGGCCLTMPKHIRQIKEEVDKDLQPLSNI